MRFRISIRGCVRPPVGPSVGPFVRHTRVGFLRNWIPELEHETIPLEHNSEAGMRGGRQVHMMSDLCQTCLLGLGAG